MISWIQTTFQRHFRVIFFTLLAVLIVSFVFTIGAAPGIGQGDRQAQARTYFDLNLSSAEGQARLTNDAQLSIMLQAGFQNFTSAQLQEFALERYAALYLANQLNLPHPLEENYKAFIKEVRAFMGPTGEFDASAYATFRDNLKLMDQFTEADVDRVLRDDYRVRQVQELLGGPGYVSDSEVEFQLDRTDTVWSADVAQLDYSTYAPTIEPTDDQLQTYFDANAFRYETMPQVRVSYVEFPATRYLAQINLTEDEIRAHYEANPARFPRAESGDDSTPVIDTSDPDIDFLAVRDRVSAALRFERARRLAAEAASDLTVAIFDNKPAPDALGDFVAAQGSTLRSAAPFDRANPPAFLNTAPQHVQAAFRLSAEDRISDPLPTAAGAVVLAWEESIPSAPSLYINVAEQVRSDYLESERRQQFVALGQRLRAELAQAVATGTSFADAISAADDLAGSTVTVESYADFTRLDPPEGLPPVVISSLEGLEAGDVSEMVLVADQGILTHASARTLPSLTKTDERYVEVRRQLAEFNAASTASGIMRDLIAAELDAGETAAN
jgi:peptidyl-prolyl cis-trans isomerase D